MKASFFLNQVTRLRTDASLYLSNTMRPDSRAQVGVGVCRLVFQGGKGVIELVAVGVERMNSVVSCGAGGAHSRHVTLKTNSYSLFAKLTEWCD